MKAHVTQQNGFPKPVGFVMILIAISILGLLQCILSTFVSAQNVNLEVLTIESEPEIENWMIDSWYWLDNTKILFQVREENPEPKLEEWMFNFSEVRTHMMYAEDEVLIEDWMVNPDEWLNSIQDWLTEEDDIEILLEAWMLNSKGWIDFKYFTQTNVNKISQE